MTANQNIHPRFDRTISRSAKERMLNQRARVIWLTGLSGSGKSTIAHELEKALVAKGFFTQLLDGDNVRAGINNNLGFSEADRRENIRRIAEVSKLFLNCGIICINSFISPTKAIRQMANDIIGRDDVIEIFVNAPLEICEQRDTKGLYKKARAGLIKDFTGISSPYEPPENPDVLLDTGRMSVEECVAACVDVVMAKVRL
jgi:adenylylsulfate kinase